MSAVCWLIRSGDDSRHAREFALNGVVALGWARVAGLGDLVGMERDDILALVEASGVSKTPTADTNELLAFRDQVEPGHVVVTPDSTTRELLIGEITGDYQYLDPSPAWDYRHVRTVKWLRRWPRHQVPDRLLDELRYRRTIRQLTHQDEWAAIIERIRKGEGRPPNTVGPVSSPRSKASTPPATPVTQLCPGCGLRRAASQFTTGSDLCTDCR